jgi:hypothetical protein
MIDLPDVGFISLAGLRVGRRKIIEELLEVALVIA